MNSFERIISDNLKKAFSSASLEEIGKRIGAKLLEDSLFLKAFGEPCIIKRDSILLSGKKDTSAMAVIVSIYTLSAKDEEVKLEPFVSFRELPGSMPYQAGFKKNTEIPLVPYVRYIWEKREKIIERLGDERYRTSQEGDFSLLLFPLPKIALKYIFYFEDEEFPASVTCLFSNNALSFLPVDPLADLSEYCSKKILEIINE